MKKYKIKKSLFPDGNKKYVVEGRSLTKYGICEGRLFKGTYDECKKFIEEKESNK